MVFIVLSRKVISIFHILALFYNSFISNLITLSRGTKLVIMNQKVKNKYLALYYTFRESPKYYSTAFH